MKNPSLQSVRFYLTTSMQPALLVLDEPTAMLDALTQACIIRLLDRIQEDRGVGMMLISHDSTLVARFCDKIYQLKAGRIDANKHQS